MDAAEPVDERSRRSGQVGHPANLPATVEDDMWAVRSRHGERETIASRRRRFHGRDRGVDAAQTVPVNIYEAPEALVVLAALPAVTPEDVTVELRPGTLRFWARLRSAGPRDYLVNEWDYGGYEREIELPDGYGSGVEATLSNGQLAVRVLRGDTTTASITPSSHG